MSGRGCFESPLEAVGNTPLVRLNLVTQGVSSAIYAKLEFLNPMGSVKDRIARYMIEKAEREGRIQNGQVIVENSSGNTALGLAFVAHQKGYRLKVVVRDRISKEKLDALKAVGAEIHMVDSSLPPEHPESYNQITPKVARETPDSFFPDQHNNRENNEAHYCTTGPEIWEQMEGRIDYFITGMGTGGTLCGTAKFLKDKDPSIRVIAVDPVGSVFYDHFMGKKECASAPYLLEGLGDEFLIGCVDFSVIDEIYKVTDREAFRVARDVALKEGLLVGGSSGASLWGALKLARSLERPARIVTILPDNGIRYMSTLFNDQWLQGKGLFPL